MCRSIHPLFNFEPGATEEEILEASLQYVRKISGFHHPSKVNEKAFDRAVAQIAKDTRNLIDSLKTDAPPRDREEEHRKAHERALKRFGPN